MQIPMFIPERTADEFRNLAIEVGSNTQRWGLADADGNTLIEPQYKSCLGDFSKGKVRLALAVKGRGEGQHDEQILVRPSGERFLPDAGPFYYVVRSGHATYGPPHLKYGVMIAWDDARHVHLIRMDGTVLNTGGFHMESWKHFDKDRRLLLSKDGQIVRINPEGEVVEIVCTVEAFVSGFKQHFLKP